MSPPVLSIPALAQPFVRAAQYGGSMTCRQLAILVAIQASPGKSVKEYAEALNLNKPSVTRACDKLVDLGWLDRMVDPQDRRCVRLTLTPTGTTVLRHVTTGEDMPRSHRSAA